MSTIDKRIYIDTLRQRLGDVVPANDMERILTIADEVLIDFDIQSVGQLKPIMTRQRVEIRVAQDMYELPDEEMRGF